MSLDTTTALTSSMMQSNHSATSQTKSLPPTSATAMDSIPEEIVQLATPSAALMQALGMDTTALDDIAYVLVVMKDWKQ
jgi:hypothetical protein